MTPVGNATARDAAVVAGAKVELLFVELEQAIKSNHARMAVRKRWPNIGSYGAKE